ncbi:MAG TPA: restriction endonuclease [Thermoanaerobaculia bacterium]
MTALLLYDAFATAVADDASLALANDGIAFTKRIADAVQTSDIDASDQVIVIFTEQATGPLSFWIGYVAGLAIPSILVDDALDIPEPLQRWTRVDRRSESWPELLCDSVRAILGWERAPITQRGPDELLNWIAEDWDRLDRLSVHEYEQLFALLLLRFDCAIEHTDAGVVLHETRNNRKFLAQFKFAGQNDTIGLTAVRECAAAVDRYKCDFGVVVSNRVFSQAAQAYSRNNAPAVWLATREWFTMAIGAHLSKRKNEPLIRLADELKADSAEAHSISWKWQIKAFQPDPPPKTVPLHFLIFHHDVSAALQFEDYCTDLNSPQYPARLSYTRVDVRQHWRKEVLDVLARDENVHFIFLDASGVTNREGRVRCYGGLTSLARDHKLQNRIDVFDDSPKWARLCMPPGFEAEFMERTRAAIEKRVKSLLAARDTLDIITKRVVQSKPQIANIPSNPDRDNDKHQLDQKKG